MTAVWTMRTKGSSVTQGKFKILNQILFYRSYTYFANILNSLLDTMRRLFSGVFLFMRFLYAFFFLITRFFLRDFLLCQMLYSLRKKRVESDN